MELLEELQIVLEHQTDVVDAILQHGDTLDADAEGEAGILVRVDIAVLQHLAVDDTAADVYKRQWFSHSLTGLPMPFG